MSLDRALVRSRLQRVLFEQPGGEWTFWSLGPRLHIHWSGPVEWLMAVTTQADLWVSQVFDGEVDEIRWLGGDSDEPSGAGWLPVHGSDEEFVYALVQVTTTIPVQGVPRFVTVAGEGSGRSLARLVVERVWGWAAKGLS